MLNFEDQNCLASALALRVLHGLGLGHEGPGLGLGLEGPGLGLEDPGLGLGLEGPGLVNIPANICVLSRFFLVELQISHWYLRMHGLPQSMAEIANHTIIQLRIVIKNRNRGCKLTFLRGQRGGF